MKVLLVCGIIVGLLSGAAPLDARSEWTEIKGIHFMVRHHPEVNSQWASQVLSMAERYYESVTRQIGVTRYRDFWTWENRVLIDLYPDHASYVSATGLPAWSRGMAARDQQTVLTRVIVSFYQEDRFLDGVLPHEIAHLILRDYLGADHALPIWFEEGVAQMQESGKLELSRQVMPTLIRQGKQIPFGFFMNHDVRTALDQEFVSIFYLQSVSVVDFLVDQFGRHKFRDLFSAVRDQRSFTESLLRVYYPEITSIDDLEKKWLSYFLRR
jgi:hypothetical protein